MAVVIIFADRAEQAEFACEQSQQIVVCILHYIILDIGILKITSFFVALLDKCISQYREHPVFGRGSLL